jgi:hypothetical protein
MTKAVMNKGMTFFVTLPGRATLVASADTIAEQSAMMRRYFTGCAYEVTFSVVKSDTAPAVSVQMKNRTAKLKKIALAAGFCVTHLSRVGCQVTATLRA